MKNQNIFELKAIIAKLGTVEDIDFEYAMQLCELEDFTDKEIAIMQKAIAKSSTLTEQEQEMYNEVQELSQKLRSDDKPTQEEVDAINAKYSADQWKSYNDKDAKFKEFLNKEFKKKIPTLSKDYMPKKLLSFPEIKLIKSILV